MADRNLLLLDSTNPISVSEANKWCSVDDAAVENFIKNITTSKGNPKEQQDKFRAIISGVPSPWARVLLTRKAVLFPKRELKDTVLDECYKLLKSEWRGLIAAYALKPGKFVFSEPIALTGKSVAENYPDMSVRYIYGQMLFNETPLWLLKNEMFDVRKNPSSIQILYYKKDDGNGFNPVPVAATSPFTFLFSSINYDLLSEEREIPWIGNDGKFFDPLTSTKFTVDDMNRLLSFLNIISTNIIPSENDENDPNKFYSEWLMSVCRTNSESYKINADEIKGYIKKFSEELGRWKEEIEDKIKEKEGKPNQNIPLTFNNKPQGPLALLLNSDYKFYFSDGVFSLVNQAGNSILSSKIFIDSDYLSAWDNNPNGKDYTKAAAYYVITDDSKYALPLPFTNEALSVFGNNIDSIVCGGSNCFVRLYAKSTTNGAGVELELKAKLDKAEPEIPICKKIYKLSPINETDGKVFAWPNFASPDWAKYYYYSEFPTNVSGVRMLPCFEDLDFSTATEEQTKNSFLVRYPLDRVAASSHKYEIIASKKPLRSVAIKLNKNGTETDGGILLLKRTQESKPNTLREIPSLAGLKDATVGIDFGSTNTCAYYKLNDGKDSKPIPFSNRRLTLVGFDSEKGALAGLDDLLFVSNEGTAFENGQVKSWLHLHDMMYLTPDGDINKVPNLGVEILGGVPVNERNIMVKSMNEQEIDTNAGKLRYNMKWYSEAESESRKTAYLKMLWIHICADMIDSDNPCFPKQLNWSFPSSMTISDRKALRKIYSSLESPLIIGGVKPKLIDFTEAESVCAYSMVKGTEVSSKTLSLGIDVGGSTSDILIMGLKEGNNTLLTQSSIRMAGGFFFNAINSSAKFRRALHNFHESHITGVNTINIADIVDSNPEIYGRAPYYLNNIFDQLSTPRDFNSFYNFIRREVAPVFAYPAYVTGVLMFYSGMLVKNAITKNSMDSIEKIEMRYYGKGGRLFEWLLDVYDEDGERYYKKCFDAGFGSKDIKLEIIHQDKKENKSEVAIGLVSNLFANIASGGVDEDGQRIIERYEIVGEKGVKCTKTGAELQDLDIIPDELFDGAVNIELPDNFENFSNFINVFSKFLIDESIIDDVSSIDKGKNNLKIRAFIQKDLEYIKCKEAYDKATDKEEKGKRSIYRIPIFIVAALSYLNDVLIPTVSEKLN